MNYSNVFKRQTLLVIGSICLIMVVFVGISYAFFTQILKTEQGVVVRSGDLKITFGEGTTISGELVPMDDDTGITNGSEYTFTVDNEGTLNATYNIQIYADTSVEGTHIPHEYVKISLDGGAARTISNLAKTTEGATEAENVYSIGTASLNTTDNKQATHSIRIWISDQAPTTVVGNVIAFKLKVVTEVDKK